MFESRSLMVIGTYLINDMQLNYNGSNYCDRTVAVFKVIYVQQICWTYMKLLKTNVHVIR